MTTNYTKSKKSKHVHEVETNSIHQLSVKAGKCEPAIDRAPWEGSVFPTSKSLLPRFKLWLPGWQDHKEAILLRHQVSSSNKIRHADSTKNNI